MGNAESLQYSWASPKPAFGRPCGRSQLLVISLAEDVSRSVFRHPLLRAHSELFPGLRLGIGVLSDYGGIYSLFAHRYRSIVYSNTSRCDGVAKVALSFNR
jgi:hypothetical protein